MRAPGLQNAVCHEPSPSSPCGATVPLLPEEEESLRRGLEGLLLGWGR